MSCVCHPLMEFGRLEAGRSLYSLPDTSQSTRKWLLTLYCKPQECQSVHLVRSMYTFFPKRRNMHETLTPHPAPLLARLPVTSVQGFFVEMSKTGDRDDEVLPLALSTGPCPVNLSLQLCSSLCNSKISPTLGRQTGLAMILCQCP